MLISALIFLPIAAAPVIFLAGRGSRTLAKVLPLAVSLVELALAVFAYGGILRDGSGGRYNYQEGPLPFVPSFPALSYQVGMDGLSAPLVLVTGFLTVLVVLGSWDLITTNQPSYYALVVLFEGTIIGVFTSLNLLVFFAFWELVLVPMFFFIGIWGGPNRKYAAMKFFIYTHVGSMVGLLGFLAVYLFSSPQTFSLIELQGKIPGWVQLFAAAATFVGFGVKLPIFPLHTWLPDAHVEAPAPISVFLAGLLLKMGGYGFLRVNLGLFRDTLPYLSTFYIAVGIVTMFYGAIVALMQRDLKRMIALTSINHMGFVLLGGFTGNIYGISGAVFQMFNHAVAIGILFMLSGYIHEQAGTRDVTVLRGMKSLMPRTASLFMLGAMAGMGVPVFSTFVSEYMVIVGAIAVDVRFAVAILIPVITVSYFLWTIRRSVLSEPATGAHRHDMTGFSAFSLSLYLVPLVILLIFPSLILDVVDPYSLRNTFGWGA